MKFRLTSLLGILLVILSIFSVSSVSEIPLTNTSLNWVLDSVITLFFFTAKKYSYNKENNNYLFYLKIYLLWVALSFIRGLITAKFYWDYKSLVDSTFALILAFSVFIFTNQYFVQSILKFWIRYGLPIFGILLFVIGTEGYGYYFSFHKSNCPFSSRFATWWRVLGFLISLFVIFSDFDARSML